MNPMIKISMIMITAILIGACGNTEAAISTALAQTQQISELQTAAAEQSFTDTPPPTETEGTPTNTPTLSTATSSIPYVSVSVDTHCRSGPRVDYKTSHNDPGRRAGHCAGHLLQCRLCGRAAPGRRGFLLAVVALCRSDGFQWLQPAGSHPATHVHTHLHPFTYLHTQPHLHTVTNTLSVQPFHKSYEAVQIEWLRALTGFLDPLGLLLVFNRGNDCDQCETVKRISTFSSIWKM